jgi:starch phosphorylase
VPRFYARDGDGVPGDWIVTMREAIAAAIWQFSTARMLGEYLEKLYRPAARSVEPAAAST